MAACHKPDCGPVDGRDPVVACGFGLVIRQSDVQTQLRMMRPEQRQAYKSIGGRRQLLANIVERELLVAEARRRGIDQSFDVIRATKQHLIHALRGKDFFGKRHELVITEEEMRGFYESHTDDYHHAIQREVDEMVCDSRDLCDALAKRVGRDDISHERFQYLARTQSPDAATPEIGGVLGWVAEDDVRVEAPLRNAVWQVDPIPGLAGPVQSARGWHLLWVSAWRAAVDQTFEEARDDVFKQIERQKWEVYVDATDARLMAGKKTEVFWDKLSRVPIFPPPSL